MRIFISASFYTPQAKVLSCLYIRWGCGALGCVAQGKSWRLVKLNILMRYKLSHLKSVILSEPTDLHPGGLSGTFLTALWIQNTSHLYPYCSSCQDFYFSSFLLHTHTVLHYLRNVASSANTVPDSCLWWKSTPVIDSRLMLRSINNDHWINSASNPDK